MSQLIARVLGLLLLFASCSGISLHGDPVQTSDAIAEEFTLELSKLYPELGSSLGYDQFDKLATVITADFDEKEKKILKSYDKKLDQYLLEVKNPELKVDLLILKERINEGLKLFELEEKYKVLPFGEVSETLFKNLFTLLKPGIPQERKRAALERFKMYVEPPNGAEPYPLAYIDYFNKKVYDYPGAHFYPYRPAVEKYLKESPIYLAGIGKMLTQLEDDSWKPYYQKLVVYIQTYDAFVAKRILPYTRKQPMLPSEIYQRLLAAQGVKETPEQLIIKGRKDFDTLFKQYNQLAKKLAAKYNLKGKTGRDVIQYFKKNKITSAKQALDLYETAAQKLETIIKKHDLVSLPPKKLRIRVASLAESRANPVPHLDIPPLKNNGDQRAEFIIPIDEKGALPFDDFSYEHAAMALTAHEGRPGHDLQFSYILDHPISTIRARYAQNATNVEGWALYAEDMVFPYLTQEEQLVALQTRLWRVARYFLDPMVQTAKASEKDVLATLDTIGVSKHMASLEYNRYAYENPAQATGYYHGLTEILKLKAGLGQKGKLNEKCFNDTIISLGLIPFEYVKLVDESFNQCL